MQLEIGEILDGKVTGITKFGVFVELAGGKTGMVHISEVASQFVKEIKDHVAEGQEVKVKVLEVKDDGRINLSIKQALPAASGAGGASSADRADRPLLGQAAWQSESGAGIQSKGFDDMLSSFLKNADEKISSIKRADTGRRRSGGRNGGGRSGGGYDFE